MNIDGLKYAMAIYAITYGLTNMRDAAHDGEWSEAQQELDLIEEELDNLAVEITEDIKHAQRIAKAIEKRRDRDDS